MTKGPSIRRPRTRLEGPGFWAAALAVLGAGALVGAALGIRFLQHGHHSGGPMFWLTAFFGLIAFGVILATFVYTVRKRRLQERSRGSMMAWLQSHVYLGLLAILAVAAHAFLVPLDSRLSSGKVASGVLVVLVVSGVLWRIVYAKVPPRVAAKVGNLALGDTRRRRAETQLALDKLAAGRSPAFRGYLDELTRGARSADAIARDAQGLDVAEQPAWAEATGLVARLGRQSERSKHQAFYARLMQGWRLIHLPLAAILLGAVAVHIVAVFGGGHLLAPPAAQHFAGSTDCAQCHAGIVQEWKLSMHRDAQTSTTTVGQTLLALQQSPTFEKACVNCHGPVGTQLSPKFTFPLSQPNPLDNPTTVDTEGITCTVCHTMAHPPVVTSGAGILPIGRRSSTSDGTIFGPPLSNPPAVPSTAHQELTGFMTTPEATSQMCGACHDVKATVGNNKILATGDSVVTGTAATGSGQLTLQTTFDEWKNYEVITKHQGQSCVECHMPAVKGSTLVDNGPLLAPGATRDRREHTFVGIDYDLNAAYYRQPGMPANGLQTVLNERANLLATAASITVTVGAPDARGRVKANVLVGNNTGHDFPTGFAFARQFWLEVSATDASGKPVCLAPDPHGLASPCSSGHLDTVTQELATCDPATTGLGNKNIAFRFTSPTTGCDPWLVNFQKILTDGDPRHTGVFKEVAYQSVLPDIVKLRVRTADQVTMAPIPPTQSTSFNYLFDASTGTKGPIHVKTVMHFRNLPPYFVQDWNAFYSPGISADQLLKNMTVVDVASNDPLPAQRTTPAPSTLGGAGR